MTPIVLVISGHDPSGGAGQIADVQTVSALGAHPALAITALTEQNTQNAYAVFATPADQVRAQLERLAEDMRPAAIKIGLLPSVDVAAALLPTLDALDGVPIVLDPVLIASGGGALAESSLVPFLKAQLLKRCTVITPNLPEAAALTGETNPQAAADALLRLGARWALVTGGDAATEQVDNLLAGESGSTIQRWPRRVGQFHGTGCTLAAALATHLALGLDVPAASKAAQAYVDRSLAGATRPGAGQSIPNRQF